MAIYQKLTYIDTENSNAVVSVQVQSAIEDRNGDPIDTTYLKSASAAVKWSLEYTVLNSSSGTLSQALNIPSSLTPRVIQIFKKTTVSTVETYALIQADASLQKTSGTWAAVLNKPASSGDWYVRILGW